MPSAGIKLATLRLLFVALTERLLAFVARIKRGARPQEAFHIHWKTRLWNKLAVA